MTDSTIQDGLTDEEKENLYDLEASPHLNDIRKQAVECMEAFFLDKKYWAGGKIPKSKLFSEENVVAVMQTNILDALDVAYACLEEQKPQRYTTHQDGEEIKGWAIPLCYEVLKACPKRMIPKCFAGGILLVYLSLCQGINYLEKLKEVNATLKGNYNNTI